jgi:hypothetical protein
MVRVGTGSPESQEPTIQRLREKETCEVVMMNIDPVTSAVDLKQYFRVGAGKAADAGKSTAATREVVQFSPKAGELRSVKDAVDSLPDVRLNKVEEIRQRIKLNDYPIENNLNAVLKDLISKNILVP